MMNYIEFISKKDVELKAVKPPFRVCGIGNLARWIYLRHGEDVKLFVNGWVNNQYLSDRLCEQINLYYQATCSQIRLLEAKYYYCAVYEGGQVAFISTERRLNIEEEASLMGDEYGFEEIQTIYIRDIEDNKWFEVCEEELEVVNQIRKEML